MSVPTLLYAMLTHPGRVRSGNEDACGASPETGLYVVCDGMGGAAGGEVASRIAAETFLAECQPDPGLTPNSLAAKPQSRLHAAVLAANAAIHQHADQRPELAGMGTTLVGLLHIPGPDRDRRSVPRHSVRPLRNLSPPTLFLVNVGDSRCYRRRAGALHQLSTDHSFVEEQMRAGYITAEQAANSPMRNYITRAVGAHKHVEPDIQSYRPEPGDLYLLASDGLTRELSDADIAVCLSRGVPSAGVTREHLERACRVLVVAANERGGHDNITVLLLAFVAASGAPSAPPPSA